MRVVLVEDHGIFREVCRKLCEETCGYEVVGEAETAAAGIALVRERRPDALLLDLGLPDRDGFAVADAASRLGSAGQRVSGSAGQRVSGSAGQRVSGSAGQRVSGSAGQRPESS